MSRFLILVPLSEFSRQGWKIPPVGRNDSSLAEKRDKEASGEAASLFIPLY